MGDDEFSPEQLLVIAILRHQGHPDPEAVVRAERLEAYRLGAHLAPPLARYASECTKVLAAYIAAIGRPNPNPPLPT